MDEMLMTVAPIRPSARLNEVVVTPGGQVGSVGVFTTHADVSKAAEQEGVRYTIVQAGRYKTEGHPYGPPR